MFGFRKPRPKVMASGDAPILRPHLSAGRRIYAIGDCHGRSDLMREMQGLIDAEERVRPPATTTEIVLGDFIDRGSDSRGVIDVLIVPPIGRERIVLGGNHEECMLRFLDEPASFAMWRKLGGFETLLSYGVRLRAAASDEQIKELADEAAQAIPDSHKTLLRTMALFHVVDGFLFVHAGIRPGVPLRDQSETDMRWIREPFLSWSGDFGYHVVHGHTPVAEPDFRANRTNIDTSAYSSGRLTCLVIEGEKMEILQTAPSSAPMQL